MTTKKKIIKLINILIISHHLHIINLLIKLIIIILLGKSKYLIINPNSLNHLNNLNIILSIAKSNNLSKKFKTFTISIKIISLPLRLKITISSLKITNQLKNKNIPSYKPTPMKSP
jgi:hypothetical protein